MWLLLFLACRPTPACATGMVPGPDRAWCIDTWEASVATDGQGRPLFSRSVPNVLPAVGLSWEDAERLCAASPMTDPTGTIVGFKHLATTTEWEDAADGVAGPGGPPFPWGDTPDPGRCALAPPSGPLPGAGLVRTGSLPGCLSPTGTFDQLGNAWEWVDSRTPMDVAAWLAASPDLRADGDRLLGVDPTRLRRYFVTVPNVDGTLAFLPDGELVLTTPLVSSVRGYLVHPAGTDLARRQLPIRLEPDPSRPGLARIRVDRPLDGHVFPEKRGGAWYAGHDVDLHTRSHSHAPDFRGTIGFRCAGPLLTDS